MKRLLTITLLAFICAGAFSQWGLITREQKNLIETNQANVAINVADIDTDSARIDALEAINDSSYVSATITTLTSVSILLTPSDTATAAEGTIYYDSDENLFYGRNNSGWVALDTQ